MNSLIHFKGKTTSISHSKEGTTLLHNWGLITASSTNTEPHHCKHPSQISVSLESASPIWTSTFTVFTHIPFLLNMLLWFKFPWQFGHMFDFSPPHIKKKKNSLNYMFVRCIYYGVMEQHNFHTVSTKLYSGITYCINFASIRTVHKHN